MGYGRKRIRGITHEEQLEYLNSSSKKSWYTSPVVFITFLQLLSYSRIYFLHDVFWDDNCWLQSIYSTEGLKGFLDTGFFELRRAPAGTFLYYLFSLHDATDYFYLIGQSINIVVQILTPIFLYLLVKNILAERQTLAFWIAVCFVIFPLDATLPVFSNLIYRLGLLFSIISFYFTAKALVRDMAQRFFLLMALIFAALSYIMIEGAIAFEPARLFIAGFIFYKKAYSLREIMKKILMIGGLFSLIGMPLIIYKLTYKTYGIYEGLYKTDYLCFLNWEMHLKVIRQFLFYNWFLYMKYINNVSIWSVLLGIITAVLSVKMIKLFIIPSEMRQSFEDKRIFLKAGFMENKELIMLFLLGIIFIVPAVIMYEFAGRVVSYGTESRHGVLLQIGYSIIVGTLVYIICNTLYSSRLRNLRLNVFIALIFGAGVFFNSAGIDMFFKTWENQRQFWSLFTKRFPSLPEEAVFLIDAKDDSPINYTELITYYDLEFPVNILYAKSNAPEKFRRYKVITAEELKGFDMDKMTGYRVLERTSHWGMDVFDLNKLIVIHYYGNKFLVNREIIMEHPDIYYKGLLDKDFPKLPEPAIYPLRYKLGGFS